MTRVKSDYSSTGYQHRTHRSRKNRKKIDLNDKDRAIRRKKYLELRKLVDLELEVV